MNHKWTCAVKPQATPLLVLSRERQPLTVQGSSAWFRHSRERDVMSVDSWDA